MTTLRTLLLGALVVLFTACGGSAGQGEGGATGSGNQSTLNVGDEFPTDEGTALSVTASVAGQTCTSETQAQVSFSGTVSTTGSVDSVIITAKVDAADAVTLDTLEPQDFTHDGRDKTATYSVSLDLTNGTHTVVLCFTQSGAQGREPKTTCADPLTVTVDCAPKNVCEDAAPFGDVVGNPSLCNGKAPNHVPVHVRGDFGDAPTLSISGPNGFTFATEMMHAGDSCNYQYNWATDGNNGGAGTYAFTVTGNGHTLTFSAELHCPGQGGGNSSRR